MDTRKETHVLENADNNDQEKETNLNNVEKDQEELVSSESPPDDKGENQENANENKENSEEIEDDKKEGEEESLDVDNDEEHVPSPPPDLVKVSEEIDEYISTLSNSSKALESSSHPLDVPISVEQFTVLVEALIEEYDSSTLPVKWDQITDEDATSFLEAVDRMTKLLNALNEYSSEYKYAYSINTVDGILQRLMAYMEEEFRDILEYHKVTEEVEENPEAEPNPEDEKSSIFLGYSGETMENLHKLVKTLMVGGHEEECCQIYFLARRDDIEEKLHKLGFEKHSIDDVQKMHWEALEKDIISWNEVVKQFTTINLVNEHRLSSTVFKDHPSVAENLFNNLANGIVVQLLIFSEAVGMTKRAPEKLFKYLDVYETLRDLCSKIEDILGPECSKEVISEALLTRGHLGEAMICIFIELENSVKSDSSKNPVPGGAVHSLTRYTMNYLEYTCEYKDTLEHVFREHEKIEGSDSASGSEHENNPSQDQNQNSSNNNNNVKKEQSPFKKQIVNVMDSLHENIVSKSKLYKDNPLSIIFMMNNCRYILQKIKACKAISGLLNDTWCRKRSSDLRQYHKNYQRETWSKLLNVLINHEGLLVKGKVLKPALKERFKSFNSIFEEIHKTQINWVILDEQLQSELRVSISNMVVPAYRSFMGRFGQTFTAGRQTEKYVKYQPEDVEARIDELFDGGSSNAGKWRM